MLITLDSKISFLKHEKVRKFFLKKIVFFFQTAYILAVAEKALEFEHRDLHWGNLLISSTKEKTASFLLEGVEYNVPLKGVKVILDKIFLLLYFKKKFFLKHSFSYF